MDYERAYQRIDTWDGRLFSAAPLKPWQKALVLFLGLMAYYLVVVSFLESPLGEGIYRDAFPFWYELDTVVLSASFWPTHMGPRYTCDGAAYPM